MLTTITKVWRLFDRAGRRRIAVLITLLLVNSVFEGLGLGAVLPLLEVVNDPSVIESRSVLRFVRDSLNIGSPTSFLVVLCFAVLAIFMGKNAFSLWMARLQFAFVWDGRARLATFLLKNYLARDLVFHLGRNSANLIRNITVSVQEVYGAVVLPLMIFITEFFITATICAILLAVEPVVTCLVAAVLGAVAGTFQFLVHKPLRKWGSEISETNEAIIREISQSLGGVKEIKILGREKYFEERFSKAMWSNSHYRILYQWLVQFPRVLLETLAVAGLILAILAGISGGHPVRELLPVLGLFGVAAMRLLPSANRLISQLNTIRYGTVSLDILYDDLTLFGTTPADARPGTARPEKLGFRERLSLENVSFQYPLRDGPAVTGVTLTIERGQSAAFVGESGTGKTTLANLVLGLLTPTDGSITIDGTLLREDNLASWQQNIGYIPQDVFLIDDTLKRNIAFGIPDHEIDLGKLSRVVALARLESLIAGWPEGIETRLGERGVMISGGQRQRVGIARALYRDATVLVLDEATSSLDVETEREITEAIATLRGDCTTLIVAHRLSTVRNCDAIFFMRDGRVVDQGRFEELVVRNPGFAKMAKTAGIDVRHAGNPQFHTGTRV